MKFRNQTSGLIAGLCLAGVPWLAVSEDNPYDGITQHNIFGLKNPGSMSATATQEVTLPGITLQGITTIFGRKEALFKVGRSANAPVTETGSCWKLGEGESTGEIVVLEINMQERSVKFRNHGTIEVKSLKDFKPNDGVLMIATTASSVAVEKTFRTEPLSETFQDTQTGNQDHSIAIQQPEKMVMANMATVKTREDTSFHGIAVAEPSIAQAPTRIVLPRNEEEASALALKEAAPY